MFVGFIFKAASISFFNRKQWVFAWNIDRCVWRRTFDCILKVALTDERILPEAMISGRWKCWTSNKHILFGNIKALIVIAKMHSRMFEFPERDNIKIEREKMCTKIGSIYFPGIYTYSIDCKNKTFSINLNNLFYQNLMLIHSSLCHRNRLGAPRSPWQLACIPQKPFNHPTRTQTVDLVMFSTVSEIPLKWAYSYRG